MEINWEAWDIQDEFPVFEAACLWLEIEPTRELFGKQPPHIVAMMDAIEKKAGGYRSYPFIGVVVSRDPYMDRALDQFVGRPPRPPDTTPSHPPAKNVTRVDLIKMAEGLGKKPKFLYPEMRVEEIQSPAQKEDTDQNPKGKTKYNTSHKSYRKLLRWLLEKQGLYPKNSDTVGKIKLGLDLMGGDDLYLDDDTIGDILAGVEESTGHINSKTASGDSASTT